MTQASMETKAVVDECDEWAENMIAQWNKTFADFDQVQQEWLDKEIKLAESYPQHWQRSHRLREYIRDYQQRHAL